MKETVELHLREIDMTELTAAASACGLTLHTFLQELAECKAAELRLARQEPEAPNAQSVN